MLCKSIGSMVGHQTTFLKTRASNLELPIHLPGSLHVKSFPTSAVRSTVCVNRHLLLYEMHRKNAEYWFSDFANCEAYDVTLSKAYLIAVRYDEISCESQETVELSMLYPTGSRVVCIVLLSTRCQLLAARK